MAPTQILCYIFANTHERGQLLAFWICKETCCIVSDFALATTENASGLSSKQTH